MSTIDHIQPQRRRLMQWLGASTLGHALVARAQDAPWPTRSIKLIVPYPAGGAPDASCRSIADVMGRNIGQSIVIDNKPGGSGLIGVRAMTAQGYDGGHTLCYVTSGHVTLNAMTPQFDLLKETRLVTMASSSPLVFVVHADSPYRTLQDVVQAMRASPGKITYGSAGAGSAAHMAAVYLEDALPGVSAQHVPYKGAIESANAILGKQIDFTIGVLGALLIHIKSGKLRALGVSTSQRIAMLPNLPTIAEQGVPGYTVSPWGGFAMHRDTPDGVVRKVHAAITQALTSDSVKQTALNMGGIVVPSESPASFTAETLRELERERQTVKRLGLDKLQG